MAVQALKVFKLASLLLCIVLFCLLMSDIYLKFSKKLTSVGVIIEEYEKDEKELPCFTLCPWDAFKRSGFHYNNDDFNKNIFDKSEIFSEQQGKDFSSQSHYNVEEIKNVFIGRCFMVCYRRPAKKLLQNYVFLKRSVDLKGNKSVAVTPIIKRTGHKPISLKYTFTKIEESIPQMPRVTIPQNLAQTASTRHFSYVT